MPAKPGHLKPVGLWNYEEVIARGSQITVKLNGETIVDADIATAGSEEIRKKHPGLDRKSGYIGFCGHGDQVEFRNLRIKTLD